MEQWIPMWKELDIDLKSHQDLMDALVPLYQELFLQKGNRPRAMEYFDAVVGDIHGTRIAELVKAREEGRPIIGTFCIFVPEEIILAAGGVCVGVCGGAQFSIPRGEEVLPQNLCPLIKSAVGFKLSRTCPYFQVLDVVVGETTCDGKKKAWETLGEFMPVEVLEVPQRREAADLELWKKEVKRFKTFMEEKGQPITPEKLREAMDLVNKKRAALAHLARLRWETPPPLSGLDGLLVEQVSFYDDPRRFTRQVEILVEELEERVEKGVGVVDTGSPRIMVAGSPMAIPNWKVHALVEEAGAVVVHEESCIGSRYYRDPVDLSGEDMDSLLEALARRYMKITCACFTPNLERPQRVVEEAISSKAHGVIYHSLSFCQIYEGEVRKVKRALEEANIPVLAITTDYSPQDREQLRTRIEAFLESL